MPRILSIVCLSLVASVAVALAADAGQPKTGTIESVDAKARTFVLTLPARPLTFTVDEKTAITLDGKPSTFELAIKAGRKTSVAYTRAGEQRLASKVEVLSAAKPAEPAASQVKAGVIKSADAKAHNFVLDLLARPLTFTVDHKTAITLDGKASTFEAAIKPDRKASVTYSRSGDARLASRIEVTSSGK